MTDQHPITPPPELVSDWRLAPEFCDGKTKLSMITITVDRLQYIATQAARWGADQELESCCEWLHWQKLAKHENLIPYLRGSRRPKPPSLKEQALQALANADGADHPIVATVITADQHSIIRRALEQLDD